MQLGIVSSILANNNYEEVIDIVKDVGFSCIEVACWPKGKAERRYAGISHIDVDEIIDNVKYKQEVIELNKRNNIDISALAYYPNTLDHNMDNRNHNIEHLKKVIIASSELDVNMVTTFIGRDQTKNIEENLDIVADVWPEIVKIAEQNNVKIAIENCPMLFGPDQWPGGQNLFNSPKIWSSIFEILDSDHIGINYDPSHFIWQKIDYIEPIYKFKEKIFHVHIKDLKVHTHKLREVGVLAYPLDFMSPKLPGQGDVDWGKYISAINDIGYDGYVCIEIEDVAFESSQEKIIDSLYLSKRYIDNFIF